MTHPPRGADAGLSLIETLVALTLTALIATTAAGGLRFGAAAWERAGTLAEAGLETRAAERFLARLLSAAEPMHLRAGRRDAPVLLEGGGQSLLFVAPLPAHLAAHQIIAGPHLIALTARRAAGAAGAPYRLEMRWAPIGAARPSIPKDAPREVLLAGLASVRFRYFGPVLGEDDRARRHDWSDDWIGRSAMPQLIEVSFDIASDPAGAPAELTARRVTARLAEGEE